MKATFLRVLPLALMFAFASCSTEDASEPTTDTRLIETYNYDAAELQLADLINEYRVSQGLNPLQMVAHVSYKSEEHNEYMIAHDVVNHDYFSDRARNIKQVLGAVRVNENIAYNYMSPEGALHAWLNSPGHKATIDGDFTHFGISISIDPETGHKYYTNIFLKK
jgi:uncharacterized protein YkwD